MQAWPDTEFSAAQISDILGVSDNTARTDLRALVRETLAGEYQTNGQKTAYSLSNSFRSFG
jgi:Fic family protein